MTVDQRVELAFGYSTFDTVPEDAWTDVTSDLASDIGGTPVSCRSGRSTSPSMGIEPGQATVSFDNLDGRFDPRNADGPYFGQLLNGVPLRILTAVGSDVVDACTPVTITVEASEAGTDPVTWTPSVTLIAGGTDASVAFLGVQGVGNGAPTDAPSTGWSDPAVLGTSLPTAIYLGASDADPDASGSVSKYQVIAGTCAYTLYLWADPKVTGDVWSVDAWISPDGTTWTLLPLDTPTTVTTGYGTAALDIGTLTAGVTPEIEAAFGEAIADAAGTVADAYDLAPGWVEPTVTGSGGSFGARIPLDLPAGATAMVTATVTVDAAPDPAADGGGALALMLADGTIVDLAGMPKPDTPYTDSYTVTGTITGPGFVVIAGNALDTSWSFYDLEVTGAATGGASNSATRWRGWVNSGWPQQFTERLPVVTITGHDVFGLLAQGDAPESAWAVTAAAHGPDHWWRASEGGWTDLVAGLSGRHTGRLERVDPVLAGVDDSFGQADPDGIGVIAHPTARINPDDGVATVACRFRFATAAQRVEQGAEPEQVIWCQTGTTSPDIDHPGNEALFKAWVDSTGALVIDVVHTNRVRSYTVDPAYRQQLLDGRTHTIVISVWSSIDEPRVWVDGRRFDLRLFGDFWFVDVTTRSVAPGDLLIGGHIDTPYTGVVDELLTWADYTGTEDDLGELAVELHRAATDGWGGQRLDERLRAIAAGMGATDSTGTLDTSGVVALQPYRPAAPIELFQTIEDTEQGRVWVDRLGRLRFAQRGWAWTDTRSTTVQATFSDVGDEIDAGAIEFRADTVLNDSPFDLINVAQVTSLTGRPRQATDQASIDATGRRSVQLSDLLHSTDYQSKAIAEWLVYSQADAPVRIERISFAVDSDPTIAAPIAQQIEEGWLVRLIKAPPALTGGDPIDLTGHVIGVENAWPFDSWIVTLWIDCTRIDRSWFRADDSTTDGADVAAF